jgi:uncharacterized protein YqfA (UPF0365 family)
MNMKTTLRYLRLNAQATWHHQVEEQLKHLHSLAAITAAEVVLEHQREAKPAEANKLIAQAHAEIQRAAAVAVEQEMTARVAEMRARVVEAEAKVPSGMAAAFRSGKIGMMN